MKIFKSTLRLSVAISLLAAMTACQQSSSYNGNGWEISVDRKDGYLTISHQDLGPVFNQLQLCLKDNEEQAGFSKVETDADKGTLLITVDDPGQTQWTILISGEGIDFSCPDTDAFVTAIAPAGEQRIPARVACQDNDVMYTQMGYVSARDIYHLFDMNTDIMIGFPEESILTRNKEDNKLMDIQLPMTEGLEISLTRDYYTSVVGLKKYQKTDFEPVFKAIPDNFKAAPTGWSSWYCYYMSPREEDLVEETDALARELEPYGLRYVQLDAAFTRGDKANWLEWNKELYPSGGKWWFDHIIQQGLKPGLWINIYGANYEKPAMADKYPEDFYLRDKEGKLSPACCSADTTVVRLDYTNPEVIEKHLRPLFETLVNDWGLGYLKAAGWGTWMDHFEESRENAFNPAMDSREAYRKALETVREVMGDDNYILGCAMHEVGVGFDYFNGSRTGGDDYASWKGEGNWSDGMQTFFKSLFGANYINGIGWWSDPDDVMIRDPLTFEEGKTIVNTISLSGQAYVISDFIADFSEERLQQFLNSDYTTGWAEDYPQLVKALPAEKLTLYKKTMPAMPVRAMDLYPYKADPVRSPSPAAFPKALDLKVNAVSGSYDVVSLYNWADTDSICELDLYNDLGLEEAEEYLAFDFWEAEMLNVVDNRIRETIPGHGSKAIIIRQSAKHPQLMATSRHLTAAYSIQSLKWDNDKLRLSGVSETVPGDIYSLYIFVPDDMAAGQLSVSAGDIEKKQLDVHLLQLNLDGGDKQVEWSVSFSK